jgi:hypothetical protein
MGNCCCCVGLRRAAIVAAAEFHEPLQLPPDKGAAGDCASKAREPLLPPCGSNVPQQGQQLSLGELCEWLSNSQQRTSGPPGFSFASFRDLLVTNHLVLADRERTLLRASEAAARFRDVPELRAPDAARRAAECVSRNLEHALRSVEPCDDARLLCCLDVTTYLQSTAAAAGSTHVRDAAARQKARCARVVSERSRELKFSNVGDVLAMLSFPLDAPCAEKD